MKINLNKSIKKMVVIILIVISTITVVVLTYIILFYSKNNTFIKDEIVNKRGTLINENINNSILQYSDQYLSFDYPIDFIYSIEREKIPTDNERNIYIMHVDDQDATDPLRVSIDIYNNPKKLIVEKYIEYQAQQGVMMLSEEIDSYQISTKRIESNDVVDYLSKRTGERNTFLRKQETIVSIQQFGNSELIEGAYNLILETIYVK